MSMKVHKSTIQHNNVRADPIFSDIKSRLPVLLNVVFTTTILLGKEKHLNDL